MLPALLLVLMAKSGVSADAPPFDLAGPKVDVHVQRDGKTLPIAQVPSLRRGDRLWIHPDLPETQSTRYVLVVTFLRGATNPPPAEWFKRVDTWNKQVREEGIFVVVPDEAQQALIFLAPETGGDFSTLRAAVRGRPGAFVRSAQDLQQASWDRLRLDAYLAEVKASSLAEPQQLKERTALAARSLGIRVDQQCFDKPTEQQAPCLVQHTDGLVLDDAGAQTRITQLANGSAADLMNQLSYSSLAGAGQFSPYVGAVVDVARILSSLHTAKYQYIPALALPQEKQADTLNLRLNVPPSFRDPKSVIVVALPPIVQDADDKTHLPQLHSVDQAENYCAQKPGLALVADGAPLVFATPLARDLVLHIETKAHAADDTKPSEMHAVLKPSSTSSAKATPDSGKPVAAIGNTAHPDRQSSGIDIPLRPDPSQGGFVLATPLPALPEDDVVAEIRGKWGFEEWVGPKFHLRTPHAGGWTISTADRNALITGREDTIHLQGQSTLCVSGVEAQIPGMGGQHRAETLSWKSPKPELLDVSVPLKDAGTGTVMIAIHQYGLSKAEELPFQAYAEAAALEHLSLSAGDKQALLKGKRLDEVQSADLAGISFTPAALNRVQGADQLEMSATGLTSTLQPGSSYVAKVTLRDGRELHVPASVDVARPQVELLSKGAQHDEADAGNGLVAAPVRLGSADDLALQSKLVFFLKSRVPASFARTEKIEVAAANDAAGSFQTTLSFADGSLVLEDAHTAVAVIDPMARFGPSAFGPIQLRAITADGTTGDWVPLGTLVRLPGFSAASSLHCPRSTAKPCSLTGSNLFLITAVSTAPDMSGALAVPPEFMGNSLNVPNVGRSGGNGTLYISLRDDPGTVQTLTLPVITAGASGSEPGNGVPGTQVPIPAPAAASSRQTPEAPPAGPKLMR